METALHVMHLTVSLSEAALHIEGCFYEWAVSQSEAPLHSEATYHSEAVLHIESETVEH